MELWTVANLKIGSLRLCCNIGDLNPVFFILIIKFKLCLVLTWIIDVVGALIMCFGKNKIMVGSLEKLDMIIGMIT